ncbi:MAG: hypothetical protein HAW62_01470 [Endozoicomonadaceae bacterium]|nr:hypothetical protein [Endozoicomonadaceae bacterium]
MREALKIQEKPITCVEIKPETLVSKKIDEIKITQSMLLQPVCLSCEKYNNSYRALEQQEQQIQQIQEQEKQAHMDMYNKIHSTIRDSRYQHAYKEAYATHYTPAMDIHDIDTMAQDKARTKIYLQETEIQKKTEDELIIYSTDMEKQSSRTIKNLEYLANQKAQIKINIEAQCLAKIKSQMKEVTCFQRMKIRQTQTQNPIEEKNRSIMTSHQDPKILLLPTTKNTSIDQHLNTAMIVNHRQQSSYQSTLPTACLSCKRFNHVYKLLEEQEIALRQKLACLQARYRHDYHTTHIHQPTGHFVEQAIKSEQNETKIMKKITLIAKKKVLNRRITEQNCLNQHGFQMQGFTCSQSAQSAIYQAQYLIQEKNKSTMIDHQNPEIPVLSTKKNASIDPHLNTPMIIDYRQQSSNQSISSKETQIPATDSDTPKQSKWDSLLCVAEQKYKEHEEHEEQAKLDSLLCVAEQKYKEHEEHEEHEEQAKLDSLLCVAEQKYKELQSQWDSVLSVAKQQNKQHEEQAKLDSLLCVAEQKYETLEKTKQASQCSGLSYQKYLLAYTEIEESKIQLKQKIQHIETQSFNAYASALLKIKQSKHRKTYHKYYNKHYKKTKDVKKSSVLAILDADQHIYISSDTLQQKAKAEVLNQTIAFDKAKHKIMVKLEDLATTEAKVQARQTTKTKAKSQRLTRQFQRLTKNAQLMSNAMHQAKIKKLYQQTQKIVKNTNSKQRACKITQKK